MSAAPVIVLGGGGHARVIVDILLACRRTVIGFVDQVPDKPPLYGVRQLGDFAQIAAGYGPDKVQLANGIGSISTPGARLDWYVYFKDRNYEFAPCIHPGSIVSPHAEVAEGGQVMAGAVLQPGAVVGENALINTRASIDHDCRLGAHVHIAPGATLSGEVIVGERTHIGAGAVVIQCMQIGSDCIVGAGAVVVRDVPSGMTVKGVPAK